MQQLEEDDVAVEVDFIHDHSECAAIFRRLEMLKLADMRKTKLKHFEGLDVAVTEVYVVYRIWSFFRPALRSRRKPYTWLMLVGGCVPVCLSVRPSNSLVRRARGLKSCTLATLVLKLGGNCLKQISAGYGRVTVAPDAET